MEKRFSGRAGGTPKGERRHRARQRGRTMRSRMVMALASVTLVAGCAGVGGGGSDGGGGATSGAAPTGTLKIMGFGGEDEVGQSRIAAFKQAFPNVTVSNAKGDFDAQQFLT